jgi:hypothetical protein
VAEVKEALLETRIAQSDDKIHRSTEKPGKT